MWNILKRIAINDCYRFKYHYRKNRPNDKYRRVLVKQLALTKTTFQQKNRPQDDSRRYLDFTKDKNSDHLSPPQRNKQSVESSTIVQGAFYYFHSPLNAC